MFDIVDIVTDDRVFEVVKWFWCRVPSHESCRQVLQTYFHLNNDVINCIYGLMQERNHHTYDMKMSLEEHVRLNKIQDERRTIARSKLLPILAIPQSFLIK